MDLRHPKTWRHPRHPRSTKRPRTNLSLPKPPTPGRARGRKRFACLACLASRASRVSSRPGCPRRSSQRLSAHARPLQWTSPSSSAAPGPSPHLMGIPWRASRGALARCRWCRCGVFSFRFWGGLEEEGRKEGRKGPETRIPLFIYPSQSKQVCRNLAESQQGSLSKQTMVADGTGEGVLH